MSETVKSLSGRRAALKGTLTRLKKFVEDANPRTVSRHELNERRNKLLNAYNDYDEVQTKIEALELESLGEDDDDAIAQLAEMQTIQRKVFEDPYFAAIAKYDSLLEGTQPAVNAVNNAPNQVVRQETAMRLPKLELKPFSGSYDEWCPFRDTYVAIIHSNATIPTIHKFQYLRLCLTGKAADVIESLELTEANYTQAWEMLEARFENTRWIVQGHIRAIFELSSVTKENHADLRALLDGVLKHMRALKALKRPTDSWDDLIIHMLVSKLDPITAKEWETSITDANMPSLKNLTDFLQKRVQALEALSSVKDSKNMIQGKSLNNQPKRAASHVASVSKDCGNCEQDHPLYKCRDFLEKSVQERFSIVKKLGLCRNCLRSTQHLAKDCNGSNCRRCDQKHNTLLHFSNNGNDTKQEPKNDSRDGANSEEYKHAAATVANATYSLANTHSVLLSTAVVKVFDVRGCENQCRVLLDSGSQLNLVSSRLAKKLQLSEQEYETTITGIGKGSVQATKMISIRIGSRVNKFTEIINCVILPKLTDRLPQELINLNSVKIPANIILADEKFNEPGEIDMIIGAEFFWRLICIGQIKAAKNQPTFQKTLLGWVVSGVTTDLTQNKNLRHNCHLAINDQLNESIKRFWEIEHGLTTYNLSPEERACEEHYLKTCKRDEDGRFVVQLPVKHDKLKQIGETKSIATKLFYSLEKRLNKQPKVKEQYSSFLNEYAILNHMREVDTNDKDSESVKFYMPHHCVLKDSSTTTKLRVVFNASSKSSTGVSLNDALMVGPILQGDLFSRLLEFRTYQYAFTGDITKMYRQVRVDSGQTGLQRILWRDATDQPLKTYELTTVTYGTASASYLAIRSVRKLAEDNCSQFPLGSNVILNNFYVDDVLSGAQSIAEALAKKQETVALLKLGGFELRKFSSNVKELRDDAHSSVKTFSDNADQPNEIKALGVAWDSFLDLFKFSSNESKFSSDVITKRGVLSRISLLFDPLGLLGPVTVLAKIFIQKLWITKIDWDSTLPFTLHDWWACYDDQLKLLRDIQIPRLVNANAKFKELQIHGFCDASEDAYGACLYLRSTSKNGEHTVRLWCSKSRVAPIKKVTIPKLELCAALLLAKLIEKALPCMTLNVTKTYLWSDSKIVLCWLKTCSRSWNTFVANRIGEIQSITALENWRHVSGKENPADLISRGVMPSAIKDQSLWWAGPSWLCEDENLWPYQVDIDVNSERLPERKSNQVTTCTSNKNFHIFERYSNLNKLFRVMAYCLRFIKGIKKQKKSKGLLSALEIDEACKILIKGIQSFAFSQIIDVLKSDENKIKKGLKSTSIVRLSPFLDSEEILRVGGRLKNTSLPYSVKHPILLPGKHPFTKMLILFEHERLNHAGAYQTLSSLRQNYWPCLGRDVVREVVRKCVTCFKANPKSQYPFMGELPKERVEAPQRPFATCGVDFAGPLYYKDGGRGRTRTVKCYIAVFVCFASKAVHLELACDLSAETFLNVLKRFISRRGRPNDIFSDNGLNFVGCNHELHDLYRLFHEEKQNEKITKFLSNERMTWHFIPPHAPHFGGLWEAAVKSAKLSLFRVIGDTSLRYEEFFTLLVQVEAILNSRPLTKLSSDANDLQPLTPAHFLIGFPLTGFPEPSLTHLPESRLSRWQRVEQLRQHFWKRWTKEYLHTLQKRTKWHESDLNTRVGQLVIVKQINMPVLTWPMGIIEIVHPGNDGIVRAVTVRTHKGTYKRPVTEICVLPITDNY